MTNREWDASLKNKDVAEKIMRLIEYEFDMRKALRLPPIAPEDQRSTSIQRIVFHIFRIYGPKPFTKAGRNAWYSTQFVYLANRLRRHPTKYKNGRKFLKMYMNYFELSRGECRRYASNLYDAAGYSILMDNAFGCMNERCPIRIHFLGEEGSPPSGRVPNPRSRVFTEEELEMVSIWTRHLKLCSNCSNAVYCSTACQRLDRKRHKEWCRSNVAVDDWPLSVRP